MEDSITKYPSGDVGAAAVAEVARREFQLIGGEHIAGIGTGVARPEGRVEMRTVVDGHGGSD
jgi:hypothetical protein